MKFKVPLALQCKALGLPQPATEFRFHPKRQWRFDLAFVEMRLAVEIEGGVFARKGAKKCETCGEIPKGRHATATGMMGDIEKYNAATSLGWRLIRVTPQMVDKGEAVQVIVNVYNALQKPLVGVPVQPSLELPTWEPRLGCTGTPTSGFCRAL